MVRVEHISSVVMRQSPNVSLSTRRMLWRTTAVQVRPHSSLSGSTVASPASATLFHRTLFDCTVSWLHTLSKFSWIHSACGSSPSENPKRFRRMLFQPRINWCHFRVKIVAATFRAESWDWECDTECSTSPLLRFFPWKSDVDNLFNKLEVWFFPPEQL